MRCTLPWRIGITVVVLGAAGAHAQAPAPGRAAEAARPTPNREGIVYLRGERIEPPFRVTAEQGRLFINGIRAETPQALADIGISEEQRAIGAGIKTLAAKTRALVDSLRALSAPSAVILDSAARLYESSALATRVVRNATGSVTVEWGGVPGSHVIDLASYLANPAVPVDSIAAAEQERAEIERLLGRGGFYAAGAGYRLAFTGALVDSMEAAIGRFRETAGDTLCLGLSRYDKLGRDLRRQWAKEAQR